MTVACTTTLLCFVKPQRLHFPLSAGRAVKARAAATAASGRDMQPGGRVLKGP